MKPGPDRKSFSNHSKNNRKNLEARFGKTLTEDLQKYLEKFEKKASANQLSKQEVSETYRQINRILDCKGATPLTQEQRNQVVRETLRHCADPEVISQGQHNTCNVTVIQVRAYALHPSKAAKVVADVATSGEYSTPSGIKVKLDAQSMVPDKEARKSSPDQGWRDYATQLFNLAAVNVWYSAVNPNMHYQQRIETDATTHKEHVRERVVDTAHGKEQAVLDPFTKKPLEDPFLSADQIAFINDAIVGKHEPNAVLVWGSKSLYLPGEKKQSVHAHDIVDEGHFQALLQKLKETHQLPAIAAVNTGVYPLNKDSGAALYGYESGGHVVNITDYTAGKNPHVSMDNQWSKLEDHPNNTVAMHDLYLCIGGQDVAAHDAGCDIIAAENKHTVAPVAKMIQLAQTPERFGVDAQYARDVANTVTGMAASEKSLSGEERQKWFAELRFAVNSTNAEDKVGLLSKIQSSAVCSHAEFGELVADSAKSISHQKKLAFRNNDLNRKRACTRATTQLAEFVLELPGEVKKRYFAKLRENE